MRRRKKKRKAESNKITAPIFATRLWNSNPGEREGTKLQHFFPRATASGPGANYTPRRAKYVTFSAAQEQTGPPNFLIFFFFSSFPGLNQTWKSGEPGDLGQKGALAIPANQPLSGHRPSGQPSACLHHNTVSRGPPPGKGKAVRTHIPGKKQRRDDGTAQNIPFLGF